MTPQKPTSAPTGCAAQEEELFENLRVAAWMFENEEDGRFSGSMAACHAVIRFIHQRNRGVELAGPFHRIREAFADLEKGGNPSLFSKKTVGNKERSRSPERKHYQRLAAVALEALVELDGDVKGTAREVAQRVNRWSCWGTQKVTGNTVETWRKNLKSRGGDDEFKKLVTLTLNEPNPRGTIDKLLRKGPLGEWRR